MFCVGFVVLVPVGSNVEVVVPIQIKWFVTTCPYLISVYNVYGIKNKDLWTGLWYRGQSLLLMPIKGHNCCWLGYWCISSLSAIFWLKPLNEEET